MEQAKKKWFLSKMLWVNVLAVLAAVVPVSADVIQQHFAVAAPVWGIINVVLRLVSKDELELW
jgi:hypothetical protein